MKTKLPVCGLVLLLLATLPPAVVAADGPNVLVMGEDADKDTVPCSSRVHQRALDALSDQIAAEGFKVFGETTVTHEAFAQGRCRRGDAELIDIARSLRKPPIDVALAFSIYASAEQLTYTTRIKSLVLARLIDVRSGKSLGSAERTSPRRINAPVDCPRECVLEVIGDETRILAQDLGAILGTKLRAQTRAHKDSGSSAALETPQSQGLSTAFVLVFDGFQPEEITEIEEYLVSFKGYEHHRPTRCSIRHCEYWYETSSDSARLNRNMRRMLDYLGVRGHVTFADHNSLLVQKIVGSN